MWYRKELQFKKKNHDDWRRNIGLQGVEAWEETTGTTKLVCIEK